MRAGAQECIVQFQRNDAIRDSEYNELSHDWVRVSEAWAKIEAVRGRERVVGNSKESDVSHLLMIDPLEGRDIKPSMRVILDKTGAFTDPAEYVYFELMAILPDFTERNEMVMQVRQVDEHATND